jgi:putative holliday junction resolvase
MRILAIDPGLKKLGLAISDPSETLARALQVLPHTTLAEDAGRIASIAEQLNADRILIGIQHIAGAVQTPITRRTHQLLAALRASTRIPVGLADESFSTQRAQQARIERGDGRQARRQADDALAAAALLQEYLDAHGKS